MPPQDGYFPWPLHSDGLILAAARSGIMMTPWPTKEAGPGTSSGPPQPWPQAILPIRRPTALLVSGSLLSKPPPGAVSAPASSSRHDLVNLGSHQPPWPGARLFFEFVLQTVPRDCGHWGKAPPSKMQILADSSRAQEDQRRKRAQSWTDGDSYTVHPLGTALKERMHFQSLAQGLACKVPSEWKPVA